MSPYESELDVSPGCNIYKALLLHAVESPDAIKGDMNMHDRPRAVHENHPRLFMFYLRAVSPQNLQL